MYNVIIAVKRKKQTNSQTSQTATKMSQIVKNAQHNFPDQFNIFTELLFVQPIAQNPDSSFNFTHEQKNIKSLHLRSDWTIIKIASDSFSFHVQLHSAKQDTIKGEHY